MAIQKDCLPLYAQAYALLVITVPWALPIPFLAFLGRSIVLNAPLPLNLSQVASTPRQITPTLLRVLKGHIACRALLPLARRARLLLPSDQLVPIVWLATIPLRPVRHHAADA